MKKKVALFLAVSMVAAAAMSGCGNSGEATSSATSTPAASSTVADGSASNASATDTSNAEYSITVGNGLVESLPNPQGCFKFKELVEANSNGQIKVDVYSNQQLGGDREMIEATQMNNIQMCTPSSTPYCNFVSEFYVWDAPFILETVDQVKEIYGNEELMEKYNQASIEKAQIRVIGNWMNGFRNVTCNGERRTPDDFKGMKIRTMENDVHLAIWKAIGANPTPMAYGEVYTALQQKTIDAQENPNDSNYLSKFCEVTDHCIQTKHVYTPYLALMSESFYQSLPDDLKTVVEEAAKEAGDYEIGLCATNDEDYKAKLNEAGCTVVELTPEERQLFIDKTNEAGIRDLVKEKSENPELTDEFFAEVDAVTSGTSTPAADSAASSAATSAESSAAE